MLKKLAVIFVLLGVGFVIMMLTTRNSSFAVSHDRTIARPSADVWRVLTDVDRWPQWWPGVQTARLSAWQSGEELELVFKGNPGADPARVEFFLEGKTLAWSRKGVLGSRTGTEIALETVSGGCRVSIVDTIYGPQAFLARFTGEEAFSKYHNLLLENLKTLVEQGAPAGEADRF